MLSYFLLHYSYKSVHMMQFPCFCLQSCHWVRLEYGIYENTPSFLFLFVESCPLLWCIIFICWSWLGISKALFSFWIFSVISFASMSCVCVCVCVYIYIYIYIYTLVQQFHLLIVVGNIESVNFFLNLQCGIICVHVLCVCVCVYIYIYIYTR